MELDAVFVLVSVAPHKPQVVAFIFVFAIAACLFDGTSYARHQVAPASGQQFLPGKALWDFLHLGHHDGPQQLHRKAVETVDDIQFLHAKQRTRKHDIGPQPLALQVTHKRNGREQVGGIVQVYGAVEQYLVQLQHLFHRLVIALFGQLLQVVLPSRGQQLLSRPRQRTQQPHQQ